MEQLNEQKVLKMLLILNKFYKVYAMSRSDIIKLSHLMEEVI